MRNNYLVRSAIKEGINIELEVVCMKFHDLTK